MQCAGTPATGRDRLIHQAWGDRVDPDEGQLPGQGLAQEIIFPGVKPLLGGLTTAFVVVLNLGRNAVSVDRPAQVTVAGGFAQEFQGLGRVKLRTSAPGWWLVPKGAHSRSPCGSRAASPSLSPHGPTGKVDNMM